MNCFNHPDRPAVIQCKECLKGFCEECSAELTDGLCSDCQARLAKKGRNNAFRELFNMSHNYGTDLLHIIIWGAAGTLLMKCLPDCKYDIALLAVIISAGWRFVNRIITSFDDRFVFSGGLLLIAMVVKLILSFLTGFFYAIFSVIMFVIQHVQKFNKR